MKDKDKLRRQFEKDKEYLKKFAPKRYFKTKERLSENRKKRNIKQKAANRKRRNEWLNSEAGKEAIRKTAEADSLALRLSLEAEKHKQQQQHQQVVLKSELSSLTERLAIKLAHCREDESHE